MTGDERRRRTPAEIGAVLDGYSRWLGECLALFYAAIKDREHGEVLPPLTRDALDRAIAARDTWAHRTGTATLIDARLLTWAAWIGAVALVVLAGFAWLVV